MFAAHDRSIAIGARCSQRHVSILDPLSFVLACPTLLLFCFLATNARAVSPHITSLLPTGGQRATELELTFTGERLQDTEEVICFEPGIAVSKLRLVTNQTVVAQVKITPQCSLGEHHLRLRTATGFSELQTFVVGPFPVMAEVEPNNDPSTAQKVPFNSTIAGVIQNEDVDCFAFEVKKGQRISAEVEGMRSEE